MPPSDDFRPPSIRERVSLRVARAGEVGEAFTFVAPDEQNDLRAIDDPRPSFGYDLGLVSDPISPLLA